MTAIDPIGLKTELMFTPQDELKAMADELFRELEKIGPADSAFDALSDAIKMLQATCTHPVCESGAINVCTTCGAFDW